MLIYDFVYLTLICMYLVFIRSKLEFNQRISLLLWVKTQIAIGLSGAWYGTRNNAPKYFRPVSGDSTVSSNRPPHGKYNVPRCCSQGLELCVTVNMFAHPPLRTRSMTSALCYTYLLSVIYSLVLVYSATLRHVAAALCTSPSVRNQTFFVSADLSQKNAFIVYRHRFFFISYVTIYASLKKIGTQFPEYSDIVDS